MAKVLPAPLLAGVVLWASLHRADAPPAPAPVQVRRPTAAPPAPPPEISRTLEDRLRGAGLPVSREARILRDYDRAFRALEHGDAELNRLVDELIWLNDALLVLDGNLGHDR